MKKALITLCVLCAATTLTGCGPKVSNIDTKNDEGKAVAGLDYRDFELAADTMIQSLITSGALRKDDNSRYLVATGQIVNDTTHRISTDQLMVKVRKALMQSGQAAMTAAVSGDGSTDDMLYNVRDLKESDVADEFNQDTMPDKGQLLAPEMSITGKIYQSNVSYDRKITQEEYYFQLRLTEIASGVVYWEEEKVLGKRVKD
ncbi:penicillin-binding protein activator LpoB [Planctomycetota bacterium]